MYTELSLAGIDVEELQGRVMNNAVLIKLLVRKFTEDNNYALLVSAIEAGDMASAERASHTLKGMCGNMSLKLLFSLFTKQVSLIRSGDAAEAAAMMPEIKAEFGNASEHMLKWLGNA